MMPENRTGEKDLALTEPVFHILLSIADQERHGYAIMQEVSERTDGAVTLGPGTLYGALKRLRAAGMIEEIESRVDPELDDSRRRYYRITPLGVEAARAEAHRVASLARQAAAKRLIPAWGVA